MSTTSKAFTVSECRSCSAAIIWAQTQKGKRMPVDAKPVENGNIRLEERMVRSEDQYGIPSYHGILTAIYEGKEQGDLFGEEIPRYVSHFVTCDDAKDWRKDA